MDDEDFQTNSQYNDDLDADIKAAMEADEPPAPAASDEELQTPVAHDKPRDEQGKFAKPEAVAEKPIKAPDSWTPAEKAHWDKLPKETQQAIARREADMHKAMTASPDRLQFMQDEDRVMGRKMKDVIAPYMADIQAEGGSPEGAVKQLLNTAYLLRRGSQEQKQAIIQEVCKAYGVEMPKVGEEPYVDPEIAALKNQIATLQQQANPQNIINQLTEQQQNAMAVKEAQAFAADPKNVYFDQVRQSMHGLLSSGLANDLQEAYDKACKLNPTISAHLEQQKQAVQDAERKKSLDAKRRAGSSINGSPAINIDTPSPSKTPLSHSDDIKADIMASMRHHDGGV